MKRTLLLAALGVGGYLMYNSLRPRYQYRGRHVVITGGSRGLGLVLARQLIQQGARVSVCSRDFQELARASDELPTLFASECDITDRLRVKEFLASARLRHGPIDVLINNAGIIRVGPLEVMNDTDYEESLHTHFWASLFTSLEVLPEMKSRGEGRIVNIASIGGKVAVPHLLPYTVGKFALVGFSDGLRTEVARHGIFVTTICPGLMRTGSHLQADFKGRHEEEYAWFALGNGLPGLSMNANSAARKILAACARGDAEAVLGIPAKLAVMARAVCPNVTTKMLALVNHWIMPEPGGIGKEVAKGHESRGKLPTWTTTLNDTAAAENNELPTAATQPVS